MHETCILTNPTSHSLPFCAFIVFLSIGTSPAVSPVSPGAGISPGPTPSLGGGSGIPGSGSGLPPGKSLTLPGGKRRTAGSSISTSTAYMKPRKMLQRAATAGEGEGGSKENANEDDKQVGGARERQVDDQHSDVEKEVKSDTEPEDTGRKPQSKLSKFGSFSAGQSSGLKDLREGRKSSMPTKSTAIAEGAESVTPPSQSKLRGPAGGLSKLQGLVPPHKHKKEATPPTSVANEDPPEESARKEPPRPQSRLKTFSSGRGTPVMGEHPRPASQMGRRVSGSTSNLTSSCEESSRPESALRVMRKGSDGVLKRHQVLQPPRTTPPTSVTSAGSSETKTSSLPRHMPKDSVAAYQKSADGGDHKEGGANKKKEEPGKDLERSLGPGLRKPGGGGGLRKPSTASCIRTPNLPSGPTPASAEGGRQAAEGRSGGEGGAQEKVPPIKVSSQKDSPLPVRSLNPPGSRLMRPTSPSPRNKTYKVNQDPQSAAGRPTGLQRPGGFQRPTHLKERSKDEMGSSSSLDSGSDVQVGGANQDIGMVNNKDTNKGKKVIDENIDMKDISRIGGTSHKEGATGQVINIQKVLSDERLVQKSDTKAESVGGAGSQKEEGLKKEEGKEDGEVVKESQDHLYGRRISPEGMSHDEINLDNLHSSGRGETGKESGIATPPSKPHLSPSHHSPSRKRHGHIIMVDTDDSESTSSTDKEGGASRDEGRESEQRQSRSSSQEALVLSPSHGGGAHVQRARSLSPKASQRLVPRGVARLKDMEGGVSGVNALQRSTSSDSTSSEGTPSSATPPEMKKPGKSSLRQNGSGSKVRRSSSSSAESNSPRQTKVTISPRSSQVSLHTHTHTHTLLSVRIV